MTEQGFQKANSRNLPCVDMEMVTNFLCSNAKFVGAELKGVKNARAGRDSYGDDAIGYVQVMRADGTCTVRSRITPEHKLRNKGYMVKVEVNEADETVLSADCEDCAASSGGCKHAIALLMWIHRRSEEPSPTSVACYWKKSKLSAVGTTLKFVCAADLCGTVKGSRRDFKVDPNFLSAVIAQGTERKCESQVLKHFSEAQSHQLLSLSSLGYRFKKSGGVEVKEFEKFCKLQMSEEHCRQVEAATVLQSNSSVWHDLRFGRITASKIHEAARCQTLGGSLTESILGAKVPDSIAMQRGRDLEPLVLQKVAEMTGCKFVSAGLVLSATEPFIGASPDALSERFVVEIKCPSKEKTVQNYVEDGKASAKCKGQIQLQMFLTGKKEGLLCVASPQFEKNKLVTIVNIKYDHVYVQKLITDALYFWERAIFPKLIE